MARTDHPLNRDTIAHTALRLIDAHGAGALTMRKLADELGTGAMSLYTYFPDKEALLCEVVQSVLGEIDTPIDDTMGWQQRVAALLVSFRTVARRHPQVVGLIARFPPREPPALRVVEAALDSLRRGGFPPETAAHAYRLLSSYALGQVQLDLAGFFNHDGSSLTETDTRLGDLIRYFPRLAEAGAHLDKYDADQEFEIGLAYILTGLLADLEQSELTTVQAQLAAIVQSSDDAIIGKTPDGVITSWNPAAERLYGYSAQEVVGRSIGIIIPRHRAAEQRHILDQISLGERFEHYDTERLCKDGSLIWVSLTVSPIIDTVGTISGASAIARQITPPTDSRRPTAVRRSRPPRRTAAGDNIEGDGASGSLKPQRSPKGQSRR